MPLIQGGIVDSHFQVSEIGYDTHQVFDAGYLENQLELPIPLRKMEPAYSESHLGGEIKQPYTDEMMEKSIERRQRRMIKNRESAARSRARKQAYTKQLEHDVVRLRETNSWLRRRKEVQNRLFSNSHSGPKYQLRRTSSTEL
ncbi:hypothetical protein M9H77_31955 [Catharanthus roseus]|uniref:Uncharacterized protein n=1 Tax=Catharanthus roseus TaxID=4058 RepID=A0ACC0A3X2_CATRO|nr:hypothetical protein M9H77_31955 [Catharanthus roseus]